MIMIIMIIIAYLLHQLLQLPRPLITMTAKTTTTLFTTFDQNV